jgi:predicted aspartyl protease
VTIGDHETADFSDQSYPPVSPSSFRPCQKWKTDADLPTLKMVIRGCPFDDVNLRRCDCRCLLTTQSTFAASLGKICAADIKAQCADVKPGGGALKDCIKTHFSDLAEDCQVAIIRAAAVGRACKADAQQFCSDVKPGNGTVAGCMKSHAADLSEGCRAAIANANGDETNPYCQLSPSSLPQSSGLRSTGVALQVEGGTFVVPVSINGAITLNFTIDSGSAHVSIPADVVLTLMGTGAIRHDDFRGSTTYTLADGSTMPSPNFNIRSLMVGGKVLENVTGSVAPVRGGLLLGQSFLSRFKSWSIDNRRQILILN